MKIQATLYIDNGASMHGLVKDFRTILGIGLKESLRFVSTKLCTDRNFHNVAASDRAHHFVVRTGESFTFILSPEQFCRYKLSKMRDVFFSDCKIATDDDSMTIDVSHLR